MDLNDEYLKMILALPDEFYEGWEWKAGDEVYARNWNMEFLVSFVSPNGVSATKLNSLTPTVTINPDVPINENIRPIPSQEQLQQIMDMSPIGFIEDFYEYAQDPLHEGMDASIFYIDLNCFTLAYVMDRKYKKYWDGESWI